MQGALVDNAFPYQLFPVVPHAKASAEKVLTLLAGIDKIGCTFLIRSKKFAFPPSDWLLPPIDANLDRLSCPRGHFVSDVSGTGRRQGQSSSRGPC